MRREHAVDWNAQQAHGGGEKRQNQDFSKNHDDIITPDEKMKKKDWISSLALDLQQGVNTDISSSSPVAASSRF